MNHTYIIDANAVLDFLEGNRGSERLERLFEDSLQEESLLLMSVVNWGEVFYYAWQHHGEESARRSLAQLSRMPLNLVTVDEQQALKAGEIKALHHIPYVDALAASLAVLRNATLVTSDRDFERLGRNFPILWINRRKD